MRNPKAEMEFLEPSPEEEEDYFLVAEVTKTPEPGKKRGRPKSKGRHRPKRRTERFRPPVMHQRKQKGAERRKDRVYYRKNRIDRLWYQNEYNRINKENPKHERAVDWREDHTKKIKRRASAEKIAFNYMAAFFVVDQTSAKDLPKQWRDMEPIGAPRGNLDHLDNPEGTVNWPDGKIRDNQIPAHPLGVDSYGGPGSSAKVIPYSGDLVNHTNWMEKNAAMNMGQILAGTDEEIFDRGDDYWPVLYRKGPKFLYFEVGDYKVRAYFPNLPFEEFRGDRIPSGLGDEDVAFDCSCKFWRWQGPEHWARVKGYDLADPRGTASVPVVRDPLGTKLVCKHVASVIKYLSKK